MLDWLLYVVGRAGRCRRPQSALTRLSTRLIDGPPRPCCRLAVAGKITTHDVHGPRSRC